MVSVYGVCCAGRKKCGKNFPLLFQSPTLAEVQVTSPISLGMPLIQATSGIVNKTELFFILMFFQPRVILFLLFLTEVSFSPILDIIPCGAGGLVVKFISPSTASKPLTILSVSSSVMTAGGVMSMTHILLDLCAIIPCSLTNFPFASSATGALRCTAIIRPCPLTSFTRLVHEGRKASLQLCQKFPSLFSSFFHLQPKRQDEEEKR